jgi:hypothetical protein
MTCMDDGGNCQWFWRTIWGLEAGRGDGMIREKEGQHYFARLELNR